MKIKTERDKYQFRLKNLYKNLLAEPHMALERGLTLEDIIVFLRAIDVLVSDVDLYPKFFEEEMEYL